MAVRLPIPSPGVRFPPPVLFLAGLAIGWALDRRWHALPLSSRAGVNGYAGPLLVMAGLALVAWGMLTFRAARTAIVPNHAASTLVASGPYRFTRNPMYTGLTIAYVGAAIWLDSGWSLIMLPLVLVLLVRLVIRREEAYLDDAFGREYASYRSRVGRWF